MRRSYALPVVAVLIAVLTLCGHTLYLKLSSHYLAPNSDATAALLNGTFQESENVITRDRMTDVSVVDGSGAVRHPDTAQWHDAGSRSILNFETGAAGTYVLGVSTAPRTITLSSADFNDYLRHDGIVDVLAARTEGDTPADSVRERYSKHVKTLVQVGDARTDTYDRRLGYPIEIVPQNNPFALEVGDTLPVLVLRDGAPVADQVVYASHEDHHAHGEDGGHEEAVQTRTNEKGIAQIPVSHEGRWYVRLIHMERPSASDLDYESNWATLTFEVR
jgi:hypothetical protein